MDINGGVGGVDMDDIMCSNAQAQVAQMKVFLALVLRCREQWSERRGRIGGGGTTDNSSALSSVAARGRVDGRGKARWGV